MTTGQTPANLLLGGWRPVKGSTLPSSARSQSQQPQTSGANPISFVLFSEDKIRQEEYLPYLTVTSMRFPHHLQIRSFSFRSLGSQHLPYYQLYFNITDEYLKQPISCTPSSNFGHRKPSLWLRTPFPARSTEGPDPGSGGQKYTCPVATGLLQHLPPPPRRLQCQWLTVGGFLHLGFFLSSRSFYWAMSSPDVCQKITPGTVSTLPRG